MHHKTVFLDRDGVINKDIGYLSDSKYFEFVDGIIDVCKYLLENNFSLIVITNQSGIARGFYKEQKFLELNEWMLKELYKRDIEILDVFYCPHGPEDNCLCRKPRPGMFINALNKYDINTKESWMVGDKEDDIIAANNASAVGVAIALDRMEKGQGERSAIQEVESDYDLQVMHIANLELLIQFIQQTGQHSEYLDAMQAYREQYGI